MQVENLASKTRMLPTTSSFVTSPLSVSSGIVAEGEDAGMNQLKAEGGGCQEDEGDDTGGEQEEALTPHERRCRMALGPLVSALLYALQHPDPPRLAPAALPLPGSPARATAVAASTKKADARAANPEAAASESANASESASSSSTASTASGNDRKEISAPPSSSDAASTVAFVPVALRTGHRCCLCGAWGFKNWDDCLGHVRTVHEADAVALTRRKDARASLRARCVAAAKDAAAALAAVEAKEAEAAAAARATALGSDASGAAAVVAGGSLVGDGAKGVSAQERKRQQEQAAAGDAAKKAQNAAAQAAAAALAAEQLRPLEFTAHDTVMETFRALQRGVAALAQREQPLQQNEGHSRKDNDSSSTGQQKKKSKKDAPLLLSDLSPRLVQLCHSGRTVTLPSSSSAASALARLKLSAAATAASFSALSDPLRLLGFDECVTALRTKTRPKQVVFVSADGKRRPYLLKGCEDLHQDQRVMQLLGAANRLLAAQPASRARHLSAGHYAVSITMIIGHAIDFVSECFYGNCMIVSYLSVLYPFFYDYCVVL